LDHQESDTTKKVFKHGLLVVHLKTKKKLAKTSSQISEAEQILIRALEFADKPFYRK